MFYDNVLAQFKELELRHYLLALLIYLVVATIWLSYLSEPRHPKSVPYVGQDPHGWLSPVRGFGKRIKWAQEGYDKYNKQNRAFILPCTPGSPNELVLPPSQLAWFIEQPDSVLSTTAAHYRLMAGAYVFHDRRIMRDVFQEHVIHKLLQRNVNAMLPDLWDEITITLDEQLGTEAGIWKDFKLSNMVSNTMPRIAHMIFVGRPVCRIPEYLRAATGHALGVASCMWFRHLTPAVLAPLVSRLVALPNWILWRRTAKYTLPMVRQRLADMERKLREPDWDWQPPNNFWTWYIRLALEEGRLDQLDPVLMTKRLMPLNFASIHTSSLTALSLILDLASSDPERGSLDAIREEVTQVLREHGTLCSKEALGKLHKTGSAVRESIRLSNFAQILVHKEVVAPEGLTNPTEGWHAPKGTLLCFASGCVHHDPEIYDSPWEYDAFRFSRAREDQDARADGDKKGFRKHQGSIVTTGDSYLAFGHGKHACPGRFFVAYVLKMMLAYMVLNYEIKPLDRRPSYKWLGMVMIPPTGTSIQVRRKEKGYV
ncbi:cytochrome P450 [Phyllosticta citriasiana]|uniref:Cytochrome P450 n=1 Tax=Phyllosticta citriasiana TaxID=595635 RepID=A0ABR1KY62_9PEZI